MITTQLIPHADTLAPIAKVHARPFPPPPPGADVLSLPVGDFIADVPLVNLVSPESNVEAQSIDGEIDADLCARFRHSGWQADRNRVWAALQASPEISDASAARFARCGECAWIEHVPQHPSAGYRVRCERCHSRWCLPCLGERCRRVRASLTKICSKKRDLSFLTLTFLGKDETLLSLVDRAASSFKALRQMPFWRAGVVGGAWMLEFKKAVRGRLWNVHIHVVMQAKFIDQQLIKDAWHAITGDSYIIKLERVRDPAATGTYVTKYVTKGVDASIIRNPALLAEAIAALHGRRMVSTFGDWRGTPLNEDPYAEENCGFIDADWERIGSVASIMLAAAAGDARCTAILIACRTRPATDTLGRPPPE